MTPSKLPNGRNDRECDAAGPGMLASRAFWLGGAMSAGVWTLLLRVVVQS
jgi:hypothetical protein